MERAGGHPRKVRAHAPHRATAAARAAPDVEHTEAFVEGAAVEAHQGGSARLLLGKPREERLRVADAVNGLDVDDVQARRREVEVGVERENRTTCNGHVTDM